MFDPIEKLKEYVRQPSVSADPQFKAGMVGAQNFVTGLLTELGFAVEVVPTALHPVIVAKRGDNPRWPHVIIYGHYDVQPPDPLDKWTTPPFEPVIKAGRIFGRGTADNKGPLMVHLTAVGRLLEKNPNLPLRITFVVEGEEEIGSKNFKTFLLANKEKLRADFVYFPTRAFRIRTRWSSRSDCGECWPLKLKSPGRKPICIPGCMAVC